MVFVMMRTVGYSVMAGTSVLNYRETCNRYVQKKGKSMRSRKSLVKLSLLVTIALGMATTCAFADDYDGDAVDDSFDLCSNTPAGIPVDSQGRPVGDFDHDCDTDIDDYTMFEQSLAGPLVSLRGMDNTRTPVSEVYAAKSLGDIDDDSDVDIKDYSLFQQSFTGQLAPAGMVFINGGEFDMGCHAETGANCDDEELPVHEVNLDPYYMSVLEVTNQQYCEYLNSAYVQGLIDDPDLHDGQVHQAGDNGHYCDTTTSSSYSRITWDGTVFAVVFGKENHPMVMVSWYGAVAYANWRSVQEQRVPCYDLSTWQCDFSVNGFRLPTEAEWEYAARGGHQSPYFAYPWGNTINGENGNYWDSGDPFEVGELPKTSTVAYYDGDQIPSGGDMVNGYGLYDMGGNVLEWCHDWHSADYYSVSLPDNPQGPSDGNLRILRGGSWLGTTNSLRCAFRGRSRPCDPSYSFGFRLVAR